jgi:2-phosphoglycerate kinase
MADALPPILIADDRHGLPFSKGLLAQSFMSAGLPPSRSYAIAKSVENQLREDGELRVTIGHLRRVASDMLEETAGAAYASRYRKIQELLRLDKPLIVMVGGTTGVGKSTVATEMAHRLGITRIVSTDSIRQVMRGIFSKDLLPAIYESSFDAWRGLRVPVPQGANPVIVGFREQTAVVSTGIKSLVERAVAERVSTVIEGVHIVPGYIEPSDFGEARVVQVVLAMDEEDSHRSHFYIREVQTDGARSFERYRANFANIRLLGSYIEELAQEHGIPIVHGHQLDQTVADTLELVVNAVIGDEVGVAARGASHRKEEGSK